MCDEEENRKIFGTKNVPNVNQLTELCSLSNSSNIDVTLNRVVNGNYANLDGFDNYIALAKRVGASAVCYRKDYSDNTLNPILIEDMLDSKKQSSGCPVCVTNSYLYKGMKVNFKMSIKEPSTVVPYIYEFVYQPDGSLTEDWAGKKKVEVKYHNAFTNEPKLKSRNKDNNTSFSDGGCHILYGSCGYGRIVNTAKKRNLPMSGSCGNGIGSSCGISYGCKS